MHTEEEHKYYEEIAATAAQIIYANRNEIEDSIISVLAKEFNNNLTARILYYFLPITFGWALLKKMGVENFPSTFNLLDKHNNEVEFRVSEQNLFMGSLTLAFKTIEYGYTDKISKAVVAELIHRSAEVNAANKALNSGAEIKGASLGPTLIHSIKAEELLNAGG